MSIEEIIKRLIELAASGPLPIGHTHRTALRAAVDWLKKQPEAQSNEPLTLEELRGMDGQPVWSEDLQCWGLVSVEREGAWGGIPFLVCTQNGRERSYYIRQRSLKLYRRPPEERVG